MNQIMCKWRVASHCNCVNRGTSVFPVPFLLGSKVWYSPPTREDRSGATFAVLRQSLFGGAYDKATRRLLGFSGFMAPRKTPQLLGCSSNQIHGLSSSLQTASEMNSSSRVNKLGRINLFANSRKEARRPSLRSLLARFKISLDKIGERSMSILFDWSLYTIVLPPFGNSEIFFVEKVGNLDVRDIDSIKRYKEKNAAFRISCKSRLYF